ncbi:hypothetical protein TrCOL_g898 [Triparma columacea]|uniref:Gamma-butyrobetaine hydroxylase-like N-terminal domain-containing protein n=1 Tax=Triparma columacea TaxID=722753 RepID=A0A9W7GLW3_9STRA|nr:hypothetical protein TrCOL_g898 [Triparma columacea]
MDGKEVGLCTGITKVSNIVAISSCKGGVGKSTTTVNLAYTLRSLGYTCGIFDADIYGPSLPTMLPPLSSTVNFVGSQIAPLEVEGGVKVMSFGYINGEGSTIRGPMLNKVLKQFIDITSWGDIDYLLVDMPPGTGDVQLTLCQMLNVTGAVIVGAPSEVAWVDVDKGIGMFEGVEVPIIGVVENMVEEEIFVGGEWEEVVREVEGRTEGVGEEDRIRVVEAWGIEECWKIPRRKDIAVMGDGGTPFVTTTGGGGGEEARGVYMEIGESIVRSCSLLKSGPPNGLSIEYFTSGKEVSIKDGGGREVGRVGGKILRAKCGCAECVEELTGRRKIQLDMIDEDVRPLRTGSVGNYGMEVEWSDGHRSLYPYKQLREIVAGES